MLNTFEEDLNKARFAELVSHILEFKTDPHNMATGPGVIICDCSCHKPCGGPGDCIHCRIIG